MIYIILFPWLNSHNSLLCETFKFILSEAELADDDELFIGPPPPAMVTESESANEAERFEEVLRFNDTSK